MQFDGMVLSHANLMLLSRSLLYTEQTIVFIFIEGTVLFTSAGEPSKPLVIRGVNSNFCYCVVLLTGIRTKRKYHSKIAARKC